MRLVILSRISRARQMPNLFVRMTWVKTRGILEFQLREITPRYYVAKISETWRPTDPEGVAYQLADCAASRRH